MFRLFLLLALILPEIVHAPPTPRISMPFRQTNAFDCQTGQTLFPLPLDEDDRQRVLAQLRKVCEDRNK